MPQSSIKPAGRPFRVDTLPPGRIVRVVRPDGSTAESRTTVSATGVRSEFALRDARGIAERWVWTDDFAGDQLDSVVREVRSEAGYQRETGLAPRAFLGRRGAVMADPSPGVRYAPLGLTYSAEYSSAALLGTGVDPHGGKAHVLVSLGVHAAFPFPGEHWDEAQIALLDGAFGKRLVLRMPEGSEKAHLDVRIEPASPAGARRLAFQGYMEDEAGKLHFVEARFDLASQPLTRQRPALWQRITDFLGRTIGFEQNARVLTAGRKAGSVRIDGVEPVRLHEALGSLDDRARFNVLPDTRLAAVNYAPQDAPLLALIDPAERQVRYSYDATLLQDDRQLLHRLLPGWLRRFLGLTAGYVVDEQGRRTEAGDRLVPDGQPLSARTYTWKFGGRPVARMKRELVRLLDERGHVELGFRETISRVP